MSDTTHPLKKDPVKWVVLNDRYYYYYMKKRWFNKNYTYAISVYSRPFVKSDGIPMSRWMPDCPEWLMNKFVGQEIAVTKHEGIDKETFDICEKDETLCLTLLSI
jgi:hypothetical protein